MNKSTLTPFFRFLSNKFNLKEDQAAEQDVRSRIRQGIEFHGTNLWILIFATFIASLGLNVNSTAVIIGAMLISPLMGPIMGLGLSLGTNDLELMKYSLRNFGFMIMVSILTSMLYFWISPLSQAQSELLARTVPTIYDVLIAFFGGLAGIVAQTRKDRTSIVIPGVAIATALMPPLCTAGYGLATGQFNYFLGAFYLFFINTVFIALGTYLVVRFLRFKKTEFLDAKKERRLRHFSLIVVLITLIPSVVIGYRIVQRSIFEVNADHFVSSVVHFPNTQVIDYTREIRSDGTAHIDLILLGEPVSSDVIDNLRIQLNNYNLQGTELTVHQSGDYGNAELSALSAGYRELIVEKNRRIEELQNKVSKTRIDTIAGQEIAHELAILSPEINQMTLSKAPIFNASGEAIDSTVICVIQLKKGVVELKEQERIERWLESRSGTKQAKIFIEQE